MSDQESPWGESPKDVIVQQKENLIISHPDGSYSFNERAVVFPSTREQVEGKIAELNEFADSEPDYTDPEVVESSAKLRNTAVKIRTGISSKRLEMGRVFTAGGKFLRKIENEYLEGITAAEKRLKDKENAEALRLERINQKETERLQGIKDRIEGFSTIAGANIGKTSAEIAVAVQRIVIDGVPTWAGVEYREAAESAIADAKRSLNNLYSMAVESEQAAQRRLEEEAGAKKVFEQQQAEIALQQELIDIKQIPFSFHNSSFIDISAKIGQLENVIDFKNSSIAVNTAKAEVIQQLVNLGEIALQRERLAAEEARIKAEADKLAADKLAAEQAKADKIEADKREAERLEQKVKEEKARKEAEAKADQEEAERVKTAKLKFEENIELTLEQMKEFDSEALTLAAIVNGEFKHLQWVDY